MSLRGLDGWVWQTSLWVGLNKEKCAIDGGWFYFEMGKAKESRFVGETRAPLSFPWLLLVSVRLHMLRYHLPGERWEATFCLHCSLIFFMGLHLSVLS